MAAYTGGPLVPNLGSVGELRAIQQRGGPGEGIGGLRGIPAKDLALITNPRLSVATYRDSMPLFPAVRDGLSSSPI
jgi:hypothetical protein